MWHEYDKHYAFNWGHFRLAHSVWQALREARARVRAVQWLVDQGLVEEADVQRFERDHPETSLP